MERWKTLHEDRRAEMQMSRLSTCAPGMLDDQPGAAAEGCGIPEHGQGGERVDHREHRQVGDVQLVRDAALLRTAVPMCCSVT